MVRHKDLILIVRFSNKHAGFRISLARLMHYSLIFGHHHAWEDFLVLQNLCIKVHRWPQPFSQSPSLFLPRGLERALGTNLR